jgi:hypothetical protein
MWFELVRVETIQVSAAVHTIETNHYLALDIRRA